MKSALQQKKEAQAIADARVMQSMAERTKTLSQVAKKAPSDIGAELYTKYSSYAVSTPDKFNRSLKTRDENNIRLAYAMHLFTKYPVPRRLHDVWFNRDATEPQFGRLRRTPVVQLETRFMDERRNCFFIVGGGGSPFKQLYKDFLTKKEVHRFLFNRHDLSYVRSIFYAIARTFTEQDAVALRIAHSKIGQMDYHVAFWRDTVRFFAANPIPLKDMNDLCDYIVEALIRNPEFTLKGRTLLSLTNMMKVWHRELRLVKQIGHHKWDGLALPEWHFSRGDDCWRIHQILDGKELAKEGVEMHHCVYSYRDMCANGRIGIFSLTFHNKNKPHGEKRMLTIEVDEHAVIKQIRGFANRSATNEEMRVLRQWCSEAGLRIGAYAL